MTLPKSQPVRNNQTSSVTEFFRFLDQQMDDLVNINMDNTPQQNDEILITYEEGKECVLPTSYAFEVNKNNVLSLKVCYEQKEYKLDPLEDDEYKQENVPEDTNTFDKVKELVLNQCHLHELFYFSYIYDGHLTAPNTIYWVVLFFKTESKRDEVSAKLKDRLLTGASNQRRNATLPLWKQHTDGLSGDCYFNASEPSDISEEVWNEWNEE